MSEDVVALALSLALLTVAGDQFVIGLARLAASLRVRPTVVGALVGGFGTSLPELIVAGVATARGSSQIAMGSLVGSIIANVSLGLAIACLVAPVRVDSRTVRREVPLSVGAVLLLAVVAHGGTSRSAGLAFAVALVIALVGLLLNARQAKPQDELGVAVVEFFDERHPHRFASELTRTALSAAVMIAGAVLLVRSCADLAKRLGVAQGLVGLTVVAVGTSAPLIVSSIQAARRGDPDLVVGNILGGNLFIALLGGATVAVLGRSEASSIGDAPLWLMAALVIAAWGFMANGRVLSRWEATALLLAYAVMLPIVTR
ncbi:MAG: sodium:calcium antiporter [Actinomycetota bacterium]|nr:sodium:calcium antiporter [Actinomycetota bacterium]